MSFFAELKRRHVFRVAGAYAVVAWLLIEVSDTVFPRLGLPGWTVTFVIALLLLGLPVALFFAWAYELTPEGLKREKDIDHSDSITPPNDKKLDRAIMAVLALALAFFAFDRFVLDPQRDAASKAAKAVAVEEARQAGRSEAVTTADDDRSIAVLAFDDMSQAGDQEYLSDGIAEELLNLLAKIPELRVISRSSAFSYKGKDIKLAQVAEELNVAHILEGSVRKAGDKVRITAQLIDARSDTHLWSETYDRTLDDVFAIQDDIAATVVAQLKITLLGEEKRALQAERAADLDAYSAYLIGRERMGLRTPEDVAAARAQFERAVALDPEYAPAHAALAHSWLVSEELDIIGEDFEREEIDAAVEPLLQRAVELDPGLPEAIAIQGLHDLRRYRYEEARKAFDRALELNPNYALAYTWRAEIASQDERFLDMLADTEKAYALDPMSLEIASDLAAAYRDFWRPEDAERVIARMFELHPDHPQAYKAAEINLRFHGRYGEAALMLERALEANPDDVWFRSAHRTILISLGLDEQLIASGDAHALFYAALSAEDFEAADAVLAEQLEGDYADHWYAAHGHELYSVYRTEDSEARLQEFVAREIEWLEAEGIPWRERCRPHLIQNLRSVGRDAAAEGMMEKCRVGLEERFKARFLCPCVFYNVVLITILDGRLDEAVERADFWLSSGDSQPYLHVDPVFRLLSERPEYAELLERNARQIERQREIYLSGGGWNALDKPDEVALER